MFASARRLLSIALLLLSIGVLFFLFMLAAAGAGGGSLDLGRALFFSLGLPCVLALAALSIDQLLWRRARGQLSCFAQKCGDNAQLALSMLGQERGNLWYLQGAVRTNVRLCSAMPGPLGVDMAETPSALRTALGIRFGRQVHRPLTEVMFLPGIPLTRPFGLRLEQRWFGRSIRTERQLKKRSACLAGDVELRHQMNTAACIQALLSLSRRRLLRIDVRAGGFSVRCQTVPTKLQDLEALIGDARILFEAYAAACGVSLDDAPAEPECISGLTLANGQASHGDERGMALAPGRAVAMADTHTAAIDDERRWAPPGYWGDGEDDRPRDADGDSPSS